MIQLKPKLTMAEQAGQLVHLSLHGEQGTGLRELELPITAHQLGAKHF
jgi:hypothetical protein